jgi:hypothetical protein
MSLEQGGMRLAPLDPDGEARTYAVITDQPLTVLGSNITDLSRGCNDTYSPSGGCDPKPTPPPESPAPARDVALVLSQNTRRWDLGLANPSGLDHAVRFDIELPADLRPGPASLELTSKTDIGEPALRLVVG